LNRNHTQRRPASRRVTPFLFPPPFSGSPAMPPSVPESHPWPALPYPEWKDTLETLHLWTQIVGKVRVARTPWINHSWNTALYVTPRGLTTSSLPHGDRNFEIEFDFVDHRLRIIPCDAGTVEMELRPRSVADFHHHLMAELEALGLGTRIHGSPNEVTDAIPFAEDEVHGSYDSEYAGRFNRVLGSSARVLWDFRGEFIGKCSPVHFFWGSFDLAVTRFSGRRAPPHPGGIPNLPDHITREAYSHEVSSVGFWPGGENHPEAIFYSYAYPGPEGFPGAKVEPPAARWSKELGEFILPYEAVRQAEDPGGALMAFARTTYEAAAELGGWDRRELEWGEGGRPGW